MSAMGRKRTSLSLCASQRLGDQFAAVADAVEGDEAAHSGALAGAQKHLVERLEPVAEGFERVVLADFEDEGLDFVARGRGVELG